MRDMPVETEIAQGFLEHQHPDLVKIVQSVKRGEESLVGVRTLLKWFNAQRRGAFVVRYIRQSLKACGVKTEPDFDSVWIDGEVKIVPLLSDPPLNSLSTFVQDAGNETTFRQQAGSVSEPLLLTGTGLEDPTYRIGKLEAANKQIVYVGPNQPLQEAITLMLLNGFSQLPVMQSSREVKGVISWESIGARLVLNRTCTEVRDCMVSAQVIDADKSLFAAIDLIAQYQYVLIQSTDKTISGIVTSTDLSRQFQQLTEPFLLLGEIEQHIRKLIEGGRFTVDQIKDSRDPSDSDRTVENVADLSMGEYIRLLENPKYWQQLGLSIDRKLFIDQLQSVRRIRNDIMHFDPDPLAQDDLLTLRGFVNFMQSLREIGVVQ